MKELTVHLGEASYDIRIGSGIIDQIDANISDLCTGHKVAIITDTNVAPLYLDRVKAAVGQCTGEVSPIIIDAGEGSKSPEQAIALVRRLLELGFTRTDVLIALGGGVIGDIVGFTASLFLRGIPYIAVPTTLLAQVDSAVGGKTAVNLPEGKNLVGTFYQPKRVIIDPACLVTLDPREFSCGMAEVIKYGAIRDAHLFSQLNECEDFQTVAEEVIAACCRIKAEIVERDEKDTGERMLLNFGHTLGHAIEKHAGYGVLSHGAAVAIGMCLIAKYGEYKGCTQPGTASRIAALCRKFGLPREYPYSDQVLTAVSYDKKNFGTMLNVVFVQKIGHAWVERCEREMFLNEIQRIW